MELSKSRKGIGSFIIDGSKNRLAKKMIHAQTQEFITRMKNMGLSNGDILKTLEEELNHE